MSWHLTTSRPTDIQERKFNRTYSATRYPRTRSNTTFLRRTLQRAHRSLVPRHSVVILKCQKRASIQTNDLQEAFVNAGENMCNNYAVSKCGQSIDVEGLQGLGPLSPEFFSTVQPHILCIIIFILGCIEMGKKKSDAFSCIMPNSALSERRW